MNKISARQLYFFLACVAPVGKLVLLPAQLVKYAGNDLLLPALTNYAVQTAAVFCLLLLVKSGLNFYELLENTFGKIAAKILACLFSLFLLLAALLPLLEQKAFVQSVFYDTLPSLVAFAPFFVFSAFVCSKPLGSYGRTWDILGPLAVFGLAGVLILSVGSADYASLLPVGASGGTGFLRGTAAIFSWFIDTALLIPFLGKIEYRKGIAWKAALCYAAGGAAVLFFLATFYGVFAETSINQLFAFTKTSKFFSGITVLGRIDYLFIFSLALVMAFYLTLPLQGSVDCVVQAFGQHRYMPTLLSLFVNAIFFTLSVVLDFLLGDILTFFAEVLFWIFPVFCVLLPPLCLLLRRKNRALS